MKMQARDPQNKWRDIEYIPDSWCGNSYHKVFLGRNEYWEFNAPVYHGELKTKLRLKLLYKRAPCQKINDIIYSNIIEGSINPAQFWREPSYRRGGLSDPYTN